ncbi:hypothetical protein [Streptomyces sp. NPDC089919]|uniref:hypothetical protein n=1 Tax=Streptomyces sp. NPDC089919 TaxID=3155188 RepID=UPI003421A3D8
MFGAGGQGAGRVVEPDWREVPVQRLTFGAPELLTAPDSFGTTLASWQSPLLSTPLGHAVTDAAPSGLLYGVAEPVPVSGAEAGAGASGDAAGGGAGPASGSGSGSDPGSGSGADFGSGGDPGSGTAAGLVAGYEGSGSGSPQERAAVPAVRPAPPGAALTVARAVELPPRPLPASLLPAPEPPVPGDRDAARPLAGDAPLTSSVGAAPSFDGPGGTPLHAPDAAVQRTAGAPGPSDADARAPGAAGRPAGQSPPTAGPDPSVVQRSAEPGAVAGDTSGGDGAAALQRSADADAGAGVGPSAVGRPTPAGPDGAAVAQRSAHEGASARYDAGGRPVPPGVDAAAGQGPADPDPGGTAAALQQSVRDAAPAGSDGGGRAGLPGTDGGGPALQRSGEPGAGATAGSAAGPAPDGGPAPAPAPTVQRAAGDAVRPLTGAAPLLGAGAPPGDPVQRLAADQMPADSPPVLPGAPALQRQPAADGALEGLLPPEAAQAVPVQRSAPGEPGGDSPSGYAPVPDTAASGDGPDPATGPGPDSSAPGAAAPLELRPLVGESPLPGSGSWDAAGAAAPVQRSAASAEGGGDVDPADAASGPQPDMSGAAGTGELRPLVGESPLRGVVAQDTTTAAASGADGGPGFGSGPAGSGAEGGSPGFEGTSGPAGSPVQRSAAPGEGDGPGSGSELPAVPAELRPLVGDSQPLVPGMPSGAQAAAPVQRVVRPAGTPEAGRPATGGASPDPAALAAIDPAAVQRTPQAGAPVVRPLTGPLAAGSTPTAGSAPVGAAAPTAWSAPAEAPEPADLLAPTSWSAPADAPAPAPAADALPAGHPDPVLQRAAEPAGFRPLVGGAAPLAADHVGTPDGTTPPAPLQRTRRLGLGAPLAAVPVPAVPVPAVPPPADPSPTTPPPADPPPAPLVQRTVSAAASLPLVPAYPLQRSVPLAPEGVAGPVAPLVGERPLELFAAAAPGGPEEAGAGAEPAVVPVEWARPAGATAGAASRTPVGPLTAQPPPATDPITAPRPPAAPSPGPGDGLPPGFPAPSEGALTWTPGTGFAPAERAPEPATAQRAAEAAPERAPEPPPAPAPEPAPRPAAAGAPPGAPKESTDELVRRLVGPLSRLLRAELRLDRERAGVRIDPRH